MSTPNGRTGFFFDEWANGGDDWQRETITAHQCPRIPPAYLENERKRGGDQWFRQEFLCEFLDADDAIFATDDIEAAIYPELSALTIRLGF